MLDIIVIWLLIVVASIDSLNFLCYWRLFFENWSWGLVVEKNQSFEDLFNDFDDCQKLFRSVVGLFEFRLEKVPAVLCTHMNEIYNWWGLFVYALKDFIGVCRRVLKKKVHFYAKHTHLVQTFSYYWSFDFNFELLLKLNNTFCYLISLYFLVLAGVEKDSAGDSLF